MLRTYDLLSFEKEAGNLWAVRLAQPADAVAAALAFGASSPY
jgi:hypothetical protein